MEEAPTIKEDKSQKTFELKSDKGNNYVFTFKNIKSASLLIEALFDDGIVKTFFESEFALDKIKENKAFISYDTIDEILEELFPLIDENKIHLFEEEGNKIKIIFELPFKKYKNMVFLICEKKKTSDAKIDELYEIIITQNKEIKDLKSKLNDVEYKLENLIEKMSKIEKENKKVLKKKTSDEKIDELYEIIITQNKEIKDLKSNSEKEKANLEKEINDLKSKLNNVTKKLENLIEKMSKLEKENIKALKKKNIKKI